MLVFLILAAGLAGSYGDEGRYEISARQVQGTAYVITNSGSYVLTENLSITGHTFGLIIQADDVAIDLNGFTLKGNTGASDCVFQDSGYARLSLRNGVLADWTKAGSFAVFALGDGTRIEDCRFTGVRQAVWAGKSARIEKCSVTRSGALAGSGFGFSVGAGSFVSECAVAGNQIGDYEAIVARAGCVVRQCSVSSNAATLGLVGIQAGAGSVLDRCLVADNSSGGDLLAIGGTNSVLVDCTAARNQSGAFDVAMLAQGNCVISDCRSYANRGASGLRAGPGALVIDCDISGNVLNGLELSGFSYALHNHVASNGVGSLSAGTLTLGTGNRMEANSLIGNYAGFRLATSNNLVGAQVASGNSTNFDITSGGPNHVGRRRAVSSPFQDWNSYGNMSH
ncbi:MAG: hypothetical protein A2X46_18770 [Lentisphaerae bacterium GWF2_57_35]|nr:MAG: hypothetical protein A2X46_18770 [Lentisphaerae bacterium GWF2_57_35]